MSKKLTSSIVALLFIAVPLWIWVIAPQLTKLPKNFSYKADIVSLDNFYDEARQQYSGEKRSVTKFSYEVTGEQNGILSLKNVFDVRTITGDKIFAVERLYGIDPKTGHHIAGHGDKDREGYLFSPKNLQKGEPFTYWHINYDGPAHMTFVREENLLGLSVYRYETDFKGVRIDQTKDLTNLPSVGVTRGIELEPRLRIWIEPVTGRMVKYEDDTVAYYYDLKTGERQNPWNHFSNSYTPESVIEQVRIAKKEKFISTLVSVKNWFTPKTHSLEKITVGSYTGEYVTLLYVAEEKGYFKDEGIDLEIKPYEYGILTIPDVVSGTIDFGLANEFASVVKSFDTPSLKIIASIDKTDSYELIARRDRGIDKPIDLKGKKIGLPRGSQSEFFLGTFFTSNNLSLADVEIVYTKPSDLEDAIISNKVDAILVWPPLSFNIAKKLDANAVVWGAQSGQDTHFVLMGTDTFVKTRPQTVERVLRALVKAEEFVKGNPQEAQNIVMRRIKVDDSYMKVEWPLNSFEVTLNQSLLRVLEDEARWAIANKVTDKTVVPNYIDFIYTDALRKVKLDGVTLY